MANVLTSLFPDLFNAMDVVSREMVGLIPAVSSDMTYDRAAVGQTVRSPVAPASTASDITAGVTPPDDGDQTIGNVSMTISKARRVPIRWNGEQKLALDNNGASYNVILRDQFAQAMRALVNEMESDLAGLYYSASRAYGTPGTTPFASSIGETAQARKIIADNGAPMTDLHMVVDTTAGANLRTLLQLTAANQAGTDDTLRRGMLLDVNGFAIRESAQIKAPAAGTMASATTNATGYAVGSTVITLALAGTGKVSAGDVITFAGDTNKYVVASASFAGANPAAGDTITIAAPGLRKAIPASATAITVEAAATRNMFFSRNALAIATRLPAIPPQGDLAIDRTQISDPVTGLSFELSAYPQYRQMQLEISAAWGVAAIKPEHMGLLLG